MVGNAVLLFSLLGGTLVPDQMSFFNHLEIFQRLGSGQVAQCAGGSLFILDTKENRLLRFGPAGQGPEVAASKGMGPGELERARFLTAVDHRLFVFQLRGYAEFDENGTFIKQFRSFELDKAAIPLSSGFLLYDPVGLNLSLTETPDGEFETLWKWQDLRLYPERRKPFTYYPAWEMARVMVHHGTENVFVVHAGISLKITAIDLNSGQRNTIDRPDLVAPAFNVRWAQGELDKRFKGNRVKLATPERFPLVKQSWLGPAETLVLEFWTADPGLKQHFLVLDQDGEPATLPFDPQWMKRVVDFDEKNAIVSVFDDENGASLVRCALSRVDEVAAKYPFTEPQPEDGWVAIQ